MNYKLIFALCLIFVPFSSQAGWLGPSDYYGGPQKLDNVLSSNL